MTDDLLNSVRQELESADCVTSVKDDLCVYIELENGDLVEMALVIPACFPYELPEFKLVGDSIDKYSKLPHVGPTGVICAFDRETNHPNPKDPGGQVLAVLRRTREILFLGICGENAEDYLDEFLAYWSYQSNCMLPLYSLVTELADKPKILTAYLPEIDNNYIFVCDSEQDAMALANKFDYPCDPSSLTQCAYIPLQNQINYPFPITHREWFNAIKQDGKHFAFYQDFLQKARNQRVVIIFSCAYQDGRRVFAAFSHLAIPRLKGFRNGKVPLDLAMSKIGELETLRHQFIDISQSRLFYRGGNGLISNIKAAILGCGSLGSQLIDSLSASGVSNYVLVDRDLLSAENIARHTCGFSDIDTPKVNAISKKLIAHNPNITCNAIARDANEILESNLDLLNDCSCIFVAVGSYPLEMHVVEKLLDGTLKAPVVLMWVEPYSLAFHALVLNKPQDVFKKMFDANIRFLDQVVENSDQLYKREAGCQSTFVQYSGLDVKAFTIDFAKSYTSGKLDNHNYHFAWYGALSQADEFGAMISSQFRNKEDYSVEIQRID